MNRDLIIVMASRVIQMAVLLLTLRAMTTRLSPLEVGNYSLLMSIGTLFVWVAISPLGLYVNRQTHGWWEKGSVRLNYAREGLYVCAVALVSALALTLWDIVFKPVWAQQLPWLGAAIGFYIVFSVGNTTIVPALNLFGKRISYSILYVATQIFCLLFSWVLTGRHPNGEHWFVGQAAGFAAAALLALPLFLKATPPKIAAERETGNLASGLRAVLAFCVPIVITSGLTWVQFQSYRIVIGDLVSLEFLGLFFAGYTASAGIMGAVEITANQFFGPYFYKHVQNAEPGHQHDAWAAYMSALYPIMIVIVMVVVTLANPITHLLLASKFWTASAYVAVGAVVEAVRVMGGTYALAAHVSKRTHILLLPHCVGAASIAVTLFCGTWFFGEAAVMPAMILSALIFLATMHVTMTRHAGTRFTILGWPWLICVGVFLAGITLLKPYLSAHGRVPDFGFVAAGGIAIFAAFLLILRDARPTLSRFAR